MGFFNTLKDTVYGFEEESPKQTPQSKPSESSALKGLYNPALERLMDIALADGELSEKEKQVLFKKAESFGIDLDEFEMVLDARLQEKVKTLQNQQSASGAAAPESNKYGDVKKCPSCGAVIKSFTTSCPDCGYEFNNIVANASFTQLYNMLVAVDNEKNNDFHITSFGKMVSNVFDDENRAKKKASIIQHYPIPTTRESILEFLTQAAPLAKSAGFFSSGDYEEREVSKAWKTKCEQIIMKAKFSMKDDKETLALIQSYANELKIKF